MATVTRNAWISLRGNADSRLKDLSVAGDALIVEQRRLSHHGARRGRVRWILNRYITKLELREVSLPACSTAQIV